MRAAARRAVNKPLVILVIDEQQMFIDLLSEKLAADRVRIVGATSIDDGKARLGIDQPHVLILDADLPQAFEVLQAIRAVNSACLIIAITRSKDTRQQLAVLGVDAILSKGEHLNAILGTLQNYAQGALSVRVEQQQQILIVDDDEEMQNCLRKWCKKRGYAASTAGTGRTAVAMMQDDPSIGVALLDINLPDMGGMEVLSTIRSWMHHPQVIIMTAIEDAVIAQRARQLGAFDYLVKPVETHALEQSIVACLAHAEYQRRSWWKRLVFSGS